MSSYDVIRFGIYLFSNIEACERKIVIGNINSNIILKPKIFFLTKTHMCPLIRKTEAHKQYLLTYGLYFHKYSYTGK